jgi:predicted enzyme related to lactoylglutathione lyase
LIKSINAVLLSTANIEPMIEFYRDKVGLPLVVSDHGAGRHAECDLGAVHFAIHGGGRADSSKAITLSFHVDDIDLEYSRMVEHGVRFENPPTPAPFGGVLAAFDDPDGNKLCLMVWQSDRDSED